MAILNGKTLYYPTIEFMSDGWVKAALCYWDRIYRIVPPSYRPHDSDEVKRAIDAGLIEDLKFSQADLSETAEKFTAFWDRVPVFPSGIEGYDDEPIRVHPEKVDARIRPILNSLAKKIDLDGFLKLSKQVAHSYMLFFAETISRRRAIPKITDDPDMFTIMHYFAEDGNFDEFCTNQEDFVCVPDLIAGALSEQFRSSLSLGVRADDILWISGASMKDKAQSILFWYATHQRRLKKHVFVIDPIPGKQSQKVSWFNFTH